MNHETSLRWLAAATERFAEVIERSELARDVPTCPGWTVADLVEHVVDIHSWVERVLATGRRAEEGEHHARPARQPHAYAAWYRERSTAMRDSMAVRDPDGQCWNFSGIDTTYGFWPRRQTHEVGVHTADAQLAASERLTFDPEVAADGIDELVRVFGVRMPQRGFPPDLRAPIAIAPDDAERSWTLHPPDDPDAAAVVTDGAADDAAAMLRGSPSDLLLVLWKRLPPDRITVDGDPEVASAYLGSRLVP